MFDAIWDPPLSSFQAGFDQMAAGLADMRVPLALAALVAARDAENRFAQEGPGWAQWTPEYYYGQVEGNPAHHGTILWMSGDMRARAIDAGNYFVSNGTLGYQFDSAKEESHQFGSSRVPARPYVGLSASGEDQVVEMFMEWVLSQTADIPSAGGLPSIPEPGTGMFMRRGRLVHVERSSLGTFMRTTVI